MPVSIALNHARRLPGTNTSSVIVNSDGTATVTTQVEVGFLDADGNFSRYGNITTNVYIVPSSVAGPLISAIEQAIATDAGLNLSGGDTVSLQ